MTNQQPILIKILFVHGLREIVEGEISQHPELASLLRVVERNADSIYFDFIPATLPDEEVNEKGKKPTQKNDVDDSISLVESFMDTLDVLAKLRSITNIYLVQKNEKFHPIHISKHKSILGTMIELVLHNQPVDTKKAFKTFKLRCAGSDTPDALAIQGYIADTFKLIASEDADLDTYIHKPGELWEVGVRVTSRPLSVRDYRVENIKGGMNPTVAYAVNTCALANVSSKQESSTTSNFSYLNVCSGSATLLIEAQIELKRRETTGEVRLLGFDIDKKTNSLAIQNIKKGGFITSIQIKTADLLEKPDFGMFDAIVSDLPFGMQISKDADLNKLYNTFMEYAGEKLNPDGTLVIYTTELDTFERAVRNSALEIIKTVSLQITTAINSTIKPNIFVCKFK